MSAYRLQCATAIVERLDLLGSLLDSPSHSIAPKSSTRPHLTTSPNPKYLFFVPRLALCAFTCSARQFSTSTPGRTNSSPLSFSTTFQAPITKSKPKKSALPRALLDLKLEAIGPYSHDASHFVFVARRWRGVLSRFLARRRARSERADSVPLGKKVNPVVRPSTLR
jgi:hypothetical protein